MKLLKKIVAGVRVRRLLLSFSEGRPSVGSVGGCEERARRHRPQAIFLGVLAVVTFAVWVEATDAAASGQQLAQPAPAQAAPKGGNVAPAWRTWKSQTTGNEYRVRVEKGVVYAEWVNVPADWAKQGAYLRTECRRSGGKWVGTSVSHLPCTAGEGQGTYIAKWCDLQTQTEIDSISPQRITGRGQRQSKIDCQQCKILEASWADFVWTPSR
ncbi:MAG TPA: hypothetical protein VKM93_25650 [Terriglobia bacterium]|nr:hypothetical protein [Terriglobia bacterium]